MKIISKINSAKLSRIAVFASEAKQSRGLCTEPWIASLRSQRRRKRLNLMPLISKIVFLLGLILGDPSFAEIAHSPIFTHDYWLPEFHHKRLSYCLTDETTCGKPVADVYCRKLGYDYAQRATKDHNIGLASYLDKDKCCRGWQCDGFNMIRCVAKTLHRPSRIADFRTRTFSKPILTDNMRLAWCFDDQPKFCGQRAATAFCRKLAYEKAIDFVQERNLAVTRQLGNGKVCFNNNCIGFASIICSH